MDLCTGLQAVKTQIRTLSGTRPRGASGGRTVMPGSWSQVLGRKFLVASSWSQVLGRKFLVASSWSQVLGGKFLVASSWSQVLGRKFLAAIFRPWRRYREAG